MNGQTDRETETIHTFEFCWKTKKTLELAKTYVISSINNIELFQMLHVNFPAKLRIFYYEKQPFLCSH